MKPSTVKAETVTDSPKKQVTQECVAGKFGIPVAELSALLGSHAWPSLQYSVLQGQERDAIVQGIENRISSSNLRVAGNNDNEVWERGWGEIHDKIRTQGFSPAILRPQYFDHHRIMRFDGDYIDGNDANFVYEYDQLLRRIVFARYLRGAKKVVELGCGTGTSQLLLAGILPQAQLTASDWAKPSQGIVREISSYLKRDIKPVCFNMLTLEGFDDLGIDHASIVLTVHALEQLGSGCEALLTKLVAVKPQYCLHLEPVAEFYDESNPFDDRALRYHRRRNYLNGWLTRLRALQAEGKVEIMEERRLGFGDRYHEAYSIIQWRAL